MYVENLEVGGLYTTEEPRTDAIELFQNYHSRYDADYMYTDDVLLQDEYFVLLEKKDESPLPSILPSICLKILTPSGIVGWTTYLHRDKKYAPVRFKKVEP